MENGCDWDLNRWPCLCEVTGLVINPQHQPSMISIIIRLQLYSIYPNPNNTELFDVKMLSMNL